MATFLDVDNEFVNAAAVLSYSRVGPFNDVLLRLVDGSERTIVNRPQYGETPEGLEELLAVIGAPEQDKTRVISFFDAKIDVHYLG
ncbi:hypothetical protein ACTD5D_40940 [Nocardia takedensis]|uniref:hypothetical protein n=1 Tax=Nocardia takedensis TaxID=259390 RepID=UPI003F76A902